MCIIHILQHLCTIHITLQRRTLQRKAIQTSITCIIHMNNTHDTSLNAIFVHYTYNTATWWKLKTSTLYPIEPNSLYIPVACVFPLSTSTSHGIQYISSTHIHYVMYVIQYNNYSDYGVATISRMLKNIGLFCKRDLQKRPIFCKETTIYHAYVTICVNYTCNTTSRTYRVV